MNRRRFEAALRDEMEAHRAAMGEPVRFGNTLHLRERSQDLWGWRRLDAFRQDVVLALRTLRRSPWFTTIAVLILSMGIGVNFAFLRIIDQSLLQPLPLKQPETLARFYRVCCDRDRSSMTTTVAIPLTDAVRRSGALAAVLTRRAVGVGWGTDGAERVQAAFVSSNWFDELGGTAAAGRLFHASDSGSFTVDVGVLSYDGWQRMFAGRDVVGEMVRVNDRPVTVVGVANRDFADVDLNIPDIWLPIEQVDAFFNTSPPSSVNWASGSEFYGRLHAGQSPQAMDERLRAVLADLASREPTHVRPGESFEPLFATERYLDTVERRQAITIATAAGGLTLLVLLIAALNLSNLMLARALSRIREMSIRAALGAGRWRAMRHMVVETVLLAGIGGLAGSGLGVVGARVALHAADLPSSIALAPDPRAAAVFVAVVAVAAIVVVLPAVWFVGRRDLALTGREGGERTTAGRGTVRLRAVLIGGQLTGCAVLLVFAGQMLTGLDRVVNRIGFEFEDVAVLEPSLAEHGMNAASATSYWSDVKSIVSASPAVEAAVLVDNAPLGGRTSISSYAAVPDLRISTVRVEPEFFALMRIPLRHGRAFERGDSGDLVIISEKVARLMYGRSNAVGEFFPPDGTRTTVIGVARDAHLFTPHATDVGEAYSRFDAGESNSAALIVRARSQVTALPGVLRQASRTAAPLITPEIRLMRSDYAARAQGPRTASATAVLTALLVLVLATVGIAGVVAYMAELRTKEMGIRMALGATSASVVRTLLGGTAVIGGVGAMLGLGGGWMVGRLFAGQPLYVEPHVVPPYALAAVTMVLSSAGAAIWPAARLLKSDPLKALRVD
jgi:predicted permease